MPLLGIGEVVGDDGQFGHTAYFFGKTETQQRPWLDDILFVQVSASSASAGLHAV